MKQLLPKEIYLEGIEKKHYPHHGPLGPMWKQIFMERLENFNMFTKAQKWILFILFVILGLGLLADSASAQSVKVDEAKDPVHTMTPQIYGGAYKESTEFRDVVTYPDGRTEVHKWTRGDEWVGLYKEGYRPKVQQHVVNAKEIACPPGNTDNLVEWCFLNRGPIVPEGMPNCEIAVATVNEDGTPISQTKYRDRAFRAALGCFGWSYEVEAAAGA